MARRVHPPPSSVTLLCPARAANAAVGKDFVVALVLDRVCAVVGVVVLVLVGNESEWQLGLWGPDS